MKKRTVIILLSIILLVVCMLLILAKNGFFKHSSNNNAEDAGNSKVSQISNANQNESSSTEIPEETEAEATQLHTSQSPKSIQKAYESAKEKGYDASIKEWIKEVTVEKKNSDGRSVYQIASENGFDGTQEEWTDQLLRVDQPEHAEEPALDAFTTDNGHLVITVGNGTTIETVDVITPEPEVTTFTVTFFDRDDSAVKVQQVKKGGFATVPEVNDPGFLGWTGNYVDVQQNETVKAVYSDSNNVFLISSDQGKHGDTVTLLVKLDGTVELCGLDMNIQYDPSLELVSVNDELDMDVVVNANEQERTIRFNFSSAMNKKRTMEIMELQFIITGEKANAYLVSCSANAVKALHENLVEDENYTIINGVVYVNE